MKFDPEDHNHFSGYVNQNILAALRADPWWLDKQPVKHWDWIGNSFDKIRIHMRCDLLRTEKNIVAYNNQESTSTKIHETLTRWKKQILSNESAQTAEQILEAEKIKYAEANNLLSSTLDVNDEIDWETLKNYADFGRKEFVTPEPIEPLPPKDIGPPPKLVTPSTNLWHSLTRKKAKIEQDAITKHNKRLAEYESALSSNRDDYNNAVYKYQQEYATWAKDRDSWYDNQDRIENQFKSSQQQHNMNIDRLQEEWVNGNPISIVEHAYLVLEGSIYPEWLTISHEIFYDQDSKTLHLSILLPKPEIANIAKNVTYVKSRDEIKKTYLSKSEQSNLYESIGYQIVIRSVHELYEADTCQHYASIAVNGYVNTVNAATGQESDILIMSAVFDRDQFLAVNLALVEAKACFKHFSGVSAAKLASLTPVRAVLEFAKDDRRFIESQAVDLNEGTNLASMDWQEFEHLVREVFHRVFAERGGEVRVTQSSNDGGVDAIGFDPDPIMGGKVVIQAKRYTRTVGVSAVRDLYGTMMNENASRAILVTTADYGPDAYKFVAEKPITLMNGGHLLSLLQRYGISGRIDIAEARS